MNALEILCRATQEPNDDLPQESMKQTYWRTNTIRWDTVQYLNPWKRARGYEDGCSNDGELYAFGCDNLDDLATHFE